MGKPEKGKGDRMSPVVRSFPAEGLSAAGVFLRLRRPGRPAFLLESAPGAGQSARYSFVGSDPFARLRVRGGRAFLKEGARPERPLAGNPFRAVERVLARHRTDPVADLPPFTGGAAGFLSYEMARHMEPALKDSLASPPGDAAFLGIYRDVVAIDHAAGRVFLVANAAGGDGPAARRSRRDARRRLAAMEGALAGSLPGDEILPSGDGDPGKARPMLGAEAFCERVSRLKRHIRAGDIFQAVLSEAVSFPYIGDPFAAYVRLRSLNPSPYLFYAEDGGRAILGSSPETLVRVSEGIAEGRMVETHPIAGTRPRGAAPADDRRLARNLRASAKERAEHLMLVDLARNDIGRVAVPGSVEVPSFMAVERYSHVMHLVSRVRGRLRPDASAFDALAACFPAGTLSGAPKIRAMQILSELEPRPRGPFGGAVLYAGFDGSLDAAITIRSLVVEKGRPGHPARAHARAGAGVVFDSVPEREYAEVMDKMRAVLAAASDAKGGTREARAAGR